MCLIWSYEQHCVFVTWPRCKADLAQGYKTFFMLNSAELEIFLLINLKLLTIANSFLLNIIKQENLTANKYENANYCCHFHIN